MSQSEQQALAFENFSDSSQLEGLQHFDQASYEAIIDQYSVSSEHDICPVCFWQADPVQNKNPEYEGGANTVSLAAARKNFVSFGASEKKFLQLVRNPLPEEI